MSEHNSMTDFTVTPKRLLNPLTGSIQSTFRFHRMNKEDLVVADADVDVLPKLQSSRILGKTIGQTLFYQHNAAKSNILHKFDFDKYIHVYWVRTTNNFFYHVEILPSCNLNHAEIEPYDS